MNAVRSLNDPSLYFASHHRIISNTTPVSVLIALGSGEYGSGMVVDLNTMQNVLFRILD
jgi:hypothetical protein